MRNQQTSELKLRTIPGLDGIASTAWNACAAGIGDNQTKSGCSELAEPFAQAISQRAGQKPHLDTDLAQGLPSNPFISYEFLSALEDSGSVGGRTGWQPLHILAETGD